VFALVKAPQEVLGASVVGLDWYEIGPTNPRGWTAVWCPDPDDLSDAELDAVLGEWDVVTVSEGWRRGDQKDREDWVLVLHVAIRFDGRRTESWTEEGGRTHAVRKVATALAERFGDLSAVPAVRWAITEQYDVADLVRSLGFQLDWSATVPTVPTDAVVVHARGSRSSVRAVEIASRLEGPVGVARLDDNWTALRLPSGRDAEYASHMAGVSTVGDHVVVLLQRGPGTSRVEVHRGGERLGAVTWDGWVRSRERDDWVTDLARLAPRLVPLSEAAAVLEGGGGDPLRRVVDMLEIPSRALVLLDGAFAASYDEVRGKASGLRFLGAVLAPGRWRLP